MGFFEGKQEFYETLFFLVIPIVIPIAIRRTKPKLLWASPLASMALGLLLTVIFYPQYLQDILGGSLDDTTAYWLHSAVPTHIVISVLAASACFLVEYLSSRKKKEE